MKFEFNLNPNELDTKTLAIMATKLTNSDSLDQLSVNIINNNNKLSENPAVEIAIIQNPNTKSNTLFRFTKHLNPIVRSELAKSQNISKEIINVLTVDDNPLVLKGLVDHCSFLDRQTFDFMLDRIIKRTIRLPLEEPLYFDLKFSYEFINSFLTHSLISSEKAKELKTWFMNLMLPEIYHALITDLKSSDLLIALIINPDLPEGIRSYIKKNINVDRLTINNINDEAVNVLLKLFN